MEFNVIVDIDGVITNIDFLKFIAALRYLNPKYVIDILRKKKERGSHTFLDTNHAKMTSNVIKRGFFYPGLALYSKKAKVRNNCSEAITKLKDDECNIIIITKRMFGVEKNKTGTKIRGHVENHLDNHEIPYDKIIYVMSNKVKECFQEQADVVIEDNPSNIIALAKAGFKVICYRTRYNKRITEDMPNVYIADNWNDVYNIVSKLKEENLLTYNYQKEKGRELKYINKGENFK